MATSYEALGFSNLSPICASLLGQRPHVKALPR
jgi:hypothetical protein